MEGGAEEPVEEPGVGEGEQVGSVVMNPNSLHIRKADHTWSSCSLSNVKKASNLKKQIT